MLKCNLHMYIKLLASLCQKWQLAEKRSKWPFKATIVLSSHWVLFAYLPRLVCPCCSVCEFVLMCVREVIMQMMVDVPVRYNVDTNTPLPTCACVFTHAHISSLRLTCDPAVVQLSQFWKDRFRGWMTKAPTMTVIVAFPAPFYLSAGKTQNPGYKNT